MKTKLIKNFAILSIGLFGLMIVGNNVFANEDSLETGEGNKGTLYNNSSGTEFCCCPGTRTCGAAECDTCPDEK